MQENQVLQQCDISEKERIIIRMLMRGASNKEIAASIHCATAHVGNELWKIRIRFGCINSIHLVVTLIKLGIVKP